MSANDQLYLRQNIQVEPLIDMWYAWPHLIPPANAARNITERHLKIMDSYQHTADPRECGQKPQNDRRSVHRLRRKAGG